MKNTFDTEFLTIFAMADLVNQPIHITTSDGIVRFVNKAWSLIYKIDPDEAIGRPIQEILDALKIDNYMITLNSGIYPDISDLTYEKIGKPTKTSAAVEAIKRREPVTMLTATPGRDKVIVSATPIFDDKNGISCVFTIIQNLTMLGRWRDLMEDETEKLKRATRELENLRGEVAQSSFIGESTAAQKIRKLIDEIASSDAGVLITGESGTGKEVVAKEIFSHSLRRDKPFVTVNCAAIPENLLESELFGHEKGSFTGAVSSKIGLFEAANHGTILLDEIGDIPLSLQPKLLRVLQESELRRVGGTKRIPIDVRVIASTNSDLKSKIEKGSFRADLFYRLNVFPIKIPPLRNRKEDIMPLAETFLKKFNAKYHKNKFFTAKGTEPLMRYDWPGNVRELENIVERIVIMGSGTAIDYPLVNSIVGFSSGASMNTSLEPAGEGLRESVKNFEKQMISDALKMYGSTYKAAEALKTSQSTIMRRMKTFGITKIYSITDAPKDESGSKQDNPQHTGKQR